MDQSADGGGDGDDAGDGTDGNKIYLKKYNGPGGEVVIPAEYDGQRFYHVEGQLFKDREDITSVVVSEGIVSLGQQALYRVESLERITLPQSLQAIDMNNLYMCHGLKEVTSPANVRIISGSFLGSCKGLEKVTFEGPCPIFRDPKFALAFSAKDMTVYVPDDQIEAYRETLTALKADQIQPSGKNAVPQTETDPALEFEPETGTVTGYRTTDAWIEIPEEIDGVRVRGIGDNFLNKCRNVFGVVLPEGIEEIGKDAFSYPANLRWVRVPESVKILGTGAFAKYGGTQMLIPPELTEIPDKAYYFAKVEGEITIPAGVTRIGAQAFYCCNVTGFTVPAGVTEIGEEAFAGYMLKSVRFEGTKLPIIATNAFDRQKEITVELGWQATDEEIQAAQETLNAMHEGVTVVRAEWPEGVPTPEPTPEPTAEPTPEPTEEPTPEPTPEPTAEPTAEPAPEIPTEAPEQQGTGTAPADETGRWGADALDVDYVGTWYEVFFARADGTTGDPREINGWTDTLQLRRDFTGKLSILEAEQTWTWNPETGGITFGSIDIMLLPGGFLQWGNRESGYVIFSRDPEGTWDPGNLMREDLEERTAGSAGAGAGEAGNAEPETPAGESGGNGTDGKWNGSIEMDVKYVCVSFESNGYHHEGSELRAEYSVVFHQNGKADFVMAGARVPNMKWVADGDAAVIDYYGQAELRFVPTEEGIRMNFFGSMDMLMLPE